MAKSSRSAKNPSGGLGWFAVLGAAILCGTYAYVVWGPARTVPESERRATTHQQAVQQTRVSVPKARYVGDNLEFSAASVEVPKGKSPEQFAITKFLEGLGFVKLAKEPNVSVSGATLTIDFGADFKETFGTEDEQTLLKGLLKTAGQFPDVVEVSFLAGGEPIESFGNVDISTPQTVIR